MQMLTSYLNSTYSMTKGMSTSYLSTGLPIVTDKINTLPCFRPEYKHHSINPAGIYFIKINN